jgi:hypothetical protein
MRVLGVKPSEGFLLHMGVMDTCELLCTNNACFIVLWSVLLCDRGNTQNMLNIVFIFQLRNLCW